MPPEKWEHVLHQTFLNRLEGLLGPGDSKIDFNDKKSVEFLSNKIKALHDIEKV
jgi:hypothetical protein